MMVKKKKAGSKLLYFIMMLDALIALMGFFSLNKYTRKFLNTYITWIVLGIILITFISVIIICVWMKKSLGLKFKSKDWYQYVIIGLVTIIFQIFTYFVPLFVIFLEIETFINTKDIEQSKEDIKLFSQCFLIGIPFLALSFIKFIRFDSVFIFIVISIIIAVVSPIFIVFRYIKCNWNNPQKLPELMLMGIGGIMEAAVFCCLMYILFLGIFKFFFDLLGGNVTFGYIVKHIDLATMVSVMISILALVLTWIVHQQKKREEQMTHLHQESNWRKKLLEFENKNYGMSALIELNSFINCFNDANYEKENNEFSNKQVNIDQVINFTLIYIYRDEMGYSNKQENKKFNAIKDYIYRKLKRYLTCLSTRKTVRLSNRFINSDFYKEICTTKEIKTIFDIYKGENSILSVDNSNLIRIAVHSLLKNDWEKVKGNIK